MTTQTELKGGEHRVVCQSITVKSESPAVRCTCVSPVRTRAKHAAKLQNPNLRRGTEGFHDSSHFTREMDADLISDGSVRAKAVYKMMCLGYLVAIVYTCYDPFANGLIAMFSPTMLQHKNFSRNKRYYLHRHEKPPAPQSPYKKNVMYIQTQVNRKVFCAPPLWPNAQKCAPRIV